VARTADRTLTLVLDPDDDGDDLARLRRLHARPLGQIVCEPAPGGGAAGLARSVLAALGKDLDVGPRRDPLWRDLAVGVATGGLHDLDCAHWPRLAGRGSARMSPVRTSRPDP
jgi:hypothetical protein